MTGCGKNKVKVGRTCVLLNKLATTLNTFNGNKVFFLLVTIKLRT